MKRLMMLSLLVTLLFTANIHARGYNVGQEVADFDLPDANGNTVYLSDYVGMGVFIAFWGFT